MKIKPYLYASKKFTVTSVKHYEKLKKGELDWKKSIKPDVKTVEIPVEVFFRLMNLDICMDNERESLTKCAFRNDAVIKPDGEHEVDPCCYVTKEIHHNVTVTVSECSRCGSVDIGWTRQDDTESEYVED